MNPINQNETFKLTVTCELICRPLSFTEDGWFPCQVVAIVTGEVNFVVFNVRTFLSSWECDVGVVRHVRRIAFWRWKKKILLMSNLQIEQISLEMRYKIN